MSFISWYGAACECLRVLASACECLRAILLASNDLLLDHGSLRGGNRLHIIAIIVLDRRHHGGDHRYASSGRAERRVILHLLLVFRTSTACRSRGHRGRLQTLEGKVADLLRELVNRNLLRAPRQAKLGAREPDAAAGDDGRHLNALGEHLLHGKTRIRAALDIVELGLKVIAVLAKGHLQIRGIRSRLAIRTHAVFDARRVERLNDLTAHVGLEPRLAVLDTLVNHLLVQRRESIQELLDVLALLLTAKGDVDGILGRAELVVDVQAKRKGHGHGGLHGQRLTIVVEVGRLGAILERARSRDGNAGGVELGGVDNAGHDGGSVSLCMTFFLVF